MSIIITYHWSIFLNKMNMLSSQQLHIFVKIIFRMMSDESEVAFQIRDNNVKYIVIEYVCNIFSKILSHKIIRIKKSFIINNSISSITYLRKVIDTSNKMYHVIYVVLYRWLIFVLVCHFQYFDLIEYYWS